MQRSILICMFMLSAIQFAQDRTESTKHSQPPAPDSGLGFIALPSFSLLAAIAAESITENCMKKISGREELSPRETQINTAITFTTGIVVFVAPLYFYFKYVT